MIHMPEDRLLYGVRIPSQEPFFCQKLFYDLNELLGRGDLPQEVFDQIAGQRPVGAVKVQQGLTPRGRRTPLGVRERASPHPRQGRGQGTPARRQPPPELRSAPHG